MRLRCYEVEPGRVALRPASPKRAWMDNTPQSFAYRCLPLTMANAHGWEILSPVGFQAEWDGGPGVESLRITLDAVSNDDDAPGATPGEASGSADSSATGSNAATPAQRGPPHSGGSSSPGKDGTPQDTAPQDSLGPRVNRGRRRERRLRSGSPLGNLVLAVTQPEAEPSPRPTLHTFVESHFGGGILTFNPLLIFDSEPGYNLWITGPTNAPKDGIAPLSAVVESDWMPFTFSMNWQLTRPGHPVRFERGEPFAHFFLVPRGVVDACEPTLEPLTNHPELHRTYTRTRLQRNMAGLTAQSDKERFLGWYTKGTHPDTGEPASIELGHQTRVTPKPFAVKE